MKCPHCNQEHEQGTLFCPQTGKKMPVPNKNCVNEGCCNYMKYNLPLDTRFCPNCGQPVEDGDFNRKFDVVLLASGSSQIQVVKVIRESIGLNLSKARDIVVGAPALVKSGLVNEEAEQLKKAIESAGAIVDIAEEGNADVVIASYMSHGGGEIRVRKEKEERSKEEEEKFHHNLALGICSLVLFGILWAILSYVQPFFGFSESLVYGIPILSGLALYRSYSR